MLSKYGLREECDWLLNGNGNPRWRLRRAARKVAALCDTDSDRAWAATELVRHTTALGIPARYARHVVVTEGRPCAGRLNYPRPDRRTTGSHSVSRPAGLAGARSADTASKPVPLS